MSETISGVYICNEGRIIMAETVLKTSCKRAMVESSPQSVIANGELSVTVHVRYRGQDIIFPVSVSGDDRNFDLLSKLRPGDEMYVSRDGENIPAVIRNPLWKRLWLQLIWSI